MGFRSLQNWVASKNSRSGDDPPPPPVLTSCTTSDMDHNDKSSEKEPTCASNPINPGPDPTLLDPAAGSSSDISRGNSHLPSSPSSSTVHPSASDPVKTPIPPPESSTVAGVSDPETDDPDLRFLSNTVSVLSDDQVESLAEALEQTAISALDPENSGPDQFESDQEETPPLPPRPGELASTKHTGFWRLPFLDKSFFRSKSRSRSVSKTRGPIHDNPDINPKGSEEASTTDGSNSTRMPSHRDSHARNEPRRSSRGHSHERVRSHSHGPSHGYSRYEASHHGPSRHSPPPSSYRYGGLTHESSKAPSRKGKESVIDPLGYAPEYTYQDAIAVVNAAEMEASKDGSKSKEKNAALGNLSARSTKLLQDFNLVLQDIGSGAPAAYSDLERLIVSNNSNIEKIFDRLPPRMQKASKTLAKRMIKSAAEKDPKVSNKLKDSDGKSLPGFMKLLDTGMVLSLLSKLRGVPAVPAAMLTPTAMASLGVFVLICSLWYCFKRGRELRLAKENEDDSDYDDRLSVRSCTCPSCLDEQENRSGRPSHRISWGRDGRPAEGLSRDRRGSCPPSSSLRPPHHHSRPLEYDRRSYESSVDSRQESHRNRGARRSPDGRSRYTDDSERELRHRERDREAERSSKKGSRFSKLW